MKETIRINESQLRKIISEAVAQQANATEYESYLSLLTRAYRACWTLALLGDNLEDYAVRCASEKMADLTNKLYRSNFINKTESIICEEIARCYRMLYGKELVDVGEFAWKHNPEGVLEEDININPENKGKFNATKKATGKSTEELTHSKNPLTRKRAIFAQNAKKWNKGK